MNQTEKKRFIKELIASVQKDVLEKVGKMPEEWDGIEIRRYIVDKFRESDYYALDRPAFRKRKRAYVNEFVVRNL